MRALVVILLSLASLAAGWTTPVVRKVRPETKLVGLVDRSTGSLKVSRPPLALSLSHTHPYYTPPMLTQPASFLAPASVKPLGARIALQSALCRCQQLVVRAAQEGGGEEGDSKLPFLLDVNTRGGLLFVSTMGTGGVIGLYKLVVATGVDGLQAGASAMLDGVCMWVRLAGRSVC